MPTIRIESYTVRVARNSAGPFARISITGPVLAHGIQNTATLFLFPAYTELGGWVTNVGGANADGIEVLAQVPFSDFDRLYDLLRNEAPLWLYYSYGQGATTAKPLTIFAIESGDEPAGEGPQDADAVEQTFRSIIAVSTADLTT
ncbi:hypothetical protein [Sanguibacter sp. 25GB23B1]|uniref:hypothetical protein n=1 Tax=unclassified Sanguibacter TaxID=2645534 RepID=UPI0032B01B2D